MQRTVELDEIFRSLDEKTRRDFQVWMQSTAAGLRGRGQDFNDALGNLAPFAENTTDLLRILDRQRPAVQGLFKNSAIVFDALSGRNGELRDLISNSNTVFSTVAARNESLQALFKALPTFERESQLTVERLDQFARETDPLVRQLTPVAQELSPTLQSLSRLAPPFRDFFVDLGPLITASYRGPAGLLEVPRRPPSGARPARSVHAHAQPGAALPQRLSARDQRLLRQLHGRGQRLHRW